MAKKSIFVSDLSGDEILEGKGAKIRITFNDSRRGAAELDVTDEEAAELARKGQDRTAGPKAEERQLRESPPSRIGPARRDPSRRSVPGGGIGRWQERARPTESWCVPS